MNSFEKFEWDFENKILTNLYPLPTADLLQSKYQKPRPQSHQEVRNKWPESARGIIRGKFLGYDETVQGIGLLIGPNVVIAEGDYLFCEKKKVYLDPKTMVFLPGANGKHESFGEVGVEKYANFSRENQPDYAIILLKQPIGYMTGHFGLACLKPEELALKKIRIIGDTEDNEEVKSEEERMWGMEGTISHIDTEQGYIHYKTDTARVQYGSGVFYEENGEYFICGIHRQSDEEKKENIATLLTRSRYKQIYDWIQEKVRIEWLLYLKKGEFRGFSNHKVGARELSFVSKYNLDGLTVFPFSNQKIDVEGLKALARNTSLINLSQLFLCRNEIDDEGFQVLAQNKSWINLAKLDLSSNKIGEKGAEALAQNESWINLSHLDLSRNMIDDKAADSLAQNKSWINIAKLDLSSNKIGEKGAEALAQNKSWINLSHLDLSRNMIDDKAAEALAQNKSWTNLSDLNLSFNKIGSQGARGLARNTSWINLSHLDLSRNQIGEEGPQGLGENTSWTNLAKLDLSLNKIGDKAAEALAQNNSWTNLSQLDFERNFIGAEGAETLAQNESWIKLSHLNLSMNKIGSQGARGLARNKSWTKLSRLNLYDNQIGDDGPLGLGENTSWIKLAELDLHLNKIDDKGAEALAQNESWINLSHLDLSRNMIGNEGAIELGQNISWINLSHLNLSLNNIDVEATQEFAQNHLSRRNLLRLVHRFRNEEPREPGEIAPWTNPFRPNLFMDQIDDEIFERFIRNEAENNLPQEDLNVNDTDEERDFKLDLSCLDRESICSLSVFLRSRIHPVLNPHHVMAEEGGQFKNLI